MNREIRAGRADRRSGRPRRPVGGPAGAEADYGAAIVQRFPEGEGILLLQMCLLLPGQDWELLVGVGGEVEGEAPPEAGLPDAQGLLHTVAAQLRYRLSSNSASNWRPSNRPLASIPPWRLMQYRKSL